MHIGELIKNFRQENKITMEEMGKILGVSKAYVSMLEKNRNSRSGKPIAPSTAILKSVADLYQISLDELLKQLDDDQPIEVVSTPKIESGYYDNPDAAEYAEEARTNPEIRVLFSATKGISKDSLQKTIDFVNFLKSQERNDGDFSE